MNTESRVRVQDGIDIFNNTMISNVKIQNTEMLSGDKQIREYAT